MKKKTNDKLIMQLSWGGPCKIAKTPIIERRTERECVVVSPPMLKLIIDCRKVKKNPKMIEG